MGDETRIPFYRDKRADTLTREELLEAYTHACDLLENYRRWARDDQDMERDFAKAREALQRG